MAISIHRTEVLSRAVSSQVFSSPSRVEFSDFELKPSRVKLDLGLTLGKPRNLSSICCIDT